MAEERFRVGAETKGGRERGPRPPSPPTKLGIVLVHYVFARTSLDAAATHCCRRRHSGNYITYPVHLTILPDKLLPGYQKEFNNFWEHCGGQVKVSRKEGTHAAKEQTRAAINTRNLSRGAKR